MAIARDTNTALQIVGPSTTGSVSHTCTGSNLILWCLMQNENQSGFNSITYGGVQLTEAITYNMTNSQQISLWYLIAPATGSNTFAVDRIGTVNDCQMQIVSYTGAKQSGVPDASISANNTTSTSLTTTLTTVADNTISVLVGYSNGSQPTAGTNSSLIASIDTDRCTAFDSTGVGPKTPPGSFAMTFTNDVSIIDAAVMASFAPFVAGGGATHNLTLLGVGT
jgi:hypothetical protein